jgi:23S rRNA pseudouridine1911/1915/1917 synthase
MQAPKKQAGESGRPAAAEQRLTVTAAEQDAGQRLDQVLALHLPALSRSRLKALIESGCVASGGRTIEQPSIRVKPGQTFAIVVPETAPAEPKPQRLPLSILYEDDQIIVIDKPAGLVVHPAPGNPEGTLVNALLAHCGESLTGIGGVRRPGIVHRLDKDTSGVMVAAKTEQAHKALVAQFAKRAIERSYLAVVWGVPQPREGEIAGAIGRHSRERKKMTVVSRGGKAALTRYHVEKVLAGGAASLLRCRLLTGRTHQIRVHLNHIGHPVIGDQTYGRATRARLERLPKEAREPAACFARQALHAETLGFRHPASGAVLRFRSLLPHDIGKLLEHLEHI